jgi:drug/metabolite transporter (DMT)-like permease
VIVGIVAAIVGWFEVWQPVWRLETIYLAAAAVLVASGSFFIVGSFRNTDVGVVAGYRYAIVIFALISGYLVWGDVPDALSFAGIGLIVGAGLYTIHRQRVRPDSRLKPTPEAAP